MPSETTPPVAFSLSAPLAQVFRATTRRPLATLGPVVVLLLPLLPLAAGLQLVLDNGGSGALQGFIAGAPKGRAGALIVRPDTDGWLLLAALVALLAAALAVILAAGVTTGAGAGAGRLGSARTGGTTHPTLSSNLARSLAVWPAMLVAITAQVLVVTLGGAIVLVAAAYAGHIRFQLTSVVELFGIGTLLVWLVRGSLWPATALAEDLPPVAALRRSWEISHGSVMRLIAAAITAVLVIVVPALVLRLIVKVILTQLAGAEVIGLSPLAIDLWSLIPVPLAIFFVSALWGREAPVLHDALVEQQRLVLAAESLDTA